MSSSETGPLMEAMLWATIQGTMLLFRAMALRLRPEALAVAGALSSKVVALVTLST